MARCKIQAHQPFLGRAGVLVDHSPGVNAPAVSFFLEYEPDQSDPWIHVIILRHFDTLAVHTGLLCTRAQLPEPQSVELCVQC